MTIAEIPEGATVPAYEFLRWFYSRQDHMWLVDRLVDGDLLNLQNPLIAQSERAAWAKLAAECNVTIRGF